MIRAVLQDAEEQPTKREPVKLWLKKLQEVAYEAEDVFDELAYENLRRKVETQEQSGREVNNFFSFSKGTRYVEKAALHVKMARKVRNINELLNKIKNEAMGYGLHVVTRDRIMPQSTWIGSQTRSSTTQLILGEMLQTLNANMGGLTNKDAVLQELEKALEGKKFLLVLDDVWNEAFGNGEASIPLDLECNGKEIAKKCRGVPLAAKVLGGTMGFKRDKEAWLSIMNSNVLNSSDDKDNVESVLKLSFDHLPPLLKPCFAYCSIFPKDFYIEKKELVQLWMAEGFLGSSSQDEGNKYFNALLQNSFSKMWKG
ncbi:hypothetical protein GH714_037483 [Hevea brasiliensis]|uniref:NB-ARC domain-containing protein n=1 Tax=Hevea brasiliensis TaxID=3981 RepID=A0A6A6L4S9_HEVBR|nr:hypothetical protein GH714_037483 [Hevea brasiliensis]